MVARRHFPSSGTCSASCTTVRSSCRLVWITPAGCSIRAGGAPHRPCRCSGVRSSWGFCFSMPSILPSSRRLPCSVSSPKGEMLRHVVAGHHACRMAVAIPRTCMASRSARTHASWLWPTSTTRSRRSASTTCPRAGGGRADVAQAMAAPELDRRCVQALPEAREQRLAIAATHLDSCPEAIDPSLGGHQEGASIFNCEPNRAERQGT